MNKRLIRFLSLLGVLAVFLTAVPSAFATYPTEYLAPPYLSGFGDSGIAWVYRDTNITGLSMQISVPTDVTIPNTDTDGCTGDTCGEGFDMFAPGMHIRGSCMIGGVAYKRVENQPETHRVELYDFCNLTGSPARPTLLYSQPITDTLWRASYVLDNVSYDPFHVGWTGQSAGSIIDDVIEVRMRKTSSTNTVFEIYNQVNSTWDTAYSLTTSTPPGSTVTDTNTYVNYFVYYGGQNKFNTSGDLGTPGVLQVRGVQVYNEGGNGAWATPLRKNITVRSGLVRWNVVSPAQISPLITDKWLAEWGADAGYAGDVGDMMLCDKRNGQTACDYTNIHVNYDRYQNWNHVGGLNYLEEDAADNLSISRASPDNSVLRSYDPKLKANRSYYFRQLNGRGGDILSVDVGGLGAGNYTITGQGYVLKDSGGAAPTCSWVTSTKYQCDGASGSPLGQVWVKVLTVNTASTITGLSVASTNDGGSQTSFTRTVYIAP